jgi:hypothetical protein
MPLDTKDDKDLNPGQADYDDKFDLNDWEARAAAPDTPGDLAAQDQRDAAMQDNGSDIPYNPSSSFDNFLDRAGNEAPDDDEASALASSTGVEPGSSHTYNPDGKKKSLGQRIRGKITKKTGLALATGGIIGGLGIFGFSSLLPLKVVHVMENIQDRFFGAGQEAIEKRAETLFSAYLRRKVLPGLKTCGSTINRNCTSPDLVGNGPFYRLAKGWSDKKIEADLAESGFEIEYDSRERKYYLIDQAGPPIDITAFANLGGGAVEENLFDRRELAGRADIRRAFRQTFADKTRLKQFWLRFKAGRMLERKYKMARCVFACNARDNLNDWKDDKTRNINNKSRAFKIKVVERVIEPRAAVGGIVLKCFLGDTKTCTDVTDKDDNGAPRRQVEKDIEVELDSRVLRRIGVESVQDLVAKLEDVEKSNSMTSYLIEQAAVKAGFSQGTSKALAGSNPIGWLEIAAKANRLLRSGDDALKVLKYSGYAATGASFWMLHQSYSDEIKAGKGDIEMVGSAANTWGDSSSDQGMGVSPVYNAVMGSSSSVATFTPTAHAATAMKCQDGETLKSGEMVCPEQTYEFGGAVDDVLGVWQGAQNVANNRFNIYGRIGNALADTWTRVVTPILNLPGDIIGKIVGPISSAIGLDALSKEVLESVQNFLMERVVGNPITPDSTGAQNITNMIGGAAAASAENGNNGMGGVALTRQQFVDLTEAHQEQTRYAFQKKSLAARFFDAEDSKSFTSQLAVGMPSSINGIFDTTANYALDPLNPLQKFVAATQTPAHAVASADGVYDATEAFGILTTGIPLEDPAVKIDPTIYTDEMCAPDSQYMNDWYNSALTDPDTGYRYHNRVNGCLFEKQAVAAVGANFTSEVLEPDERDLSGQAATSNGDEVATGVDTSAQQCPADPDITDGGIKERYGVGRVLRYKIRVCLIKGSPTFDVNVSIAKKTVDMVRAAQSAGVTLTGGGYRTFDEQVALRGKNGCPDTYTSSASTCDTPTARPGESNHEEGTAIDFDGIDKQGRNCTNPGNKTWDWLRANASRFGFTQLSSECWHWSVGGG